MCSISCKRPRSCGNGTLDADLGEECDLGGNNGVMLDTNREPVTDGSGGQIYCNTDCTIPAGIVY